MIRLGVLATLCVLLFVVGCGEQAPAPDVLGEALDQAKKEIDAAGLDNEIEDDTAFGVIVESNFKVCEQDPAPGEETSNVTLTVDRSCPGLRAEEETGSLVVASASDLAFMEKKIVQEYRVEADLTGDLGADYAATCEAAGPGKAVCKIQPFMNGDEPLAPYNRTVKFGDDPHAFKVP